MARAIDDQQFLKTENMNTIIDTLSIWTTAQKLKTSGRGRSASNQSLHGTNKLRELILELAVCGKLVNQNPSDEPVSVLLDKIAKEKKRLIKEGKIKKQEKQLAIEDDEIPFELPKLWNWVRLGDVTNYGILEKVELYNVNENTWVLELEDVEKGTSKLLQKVRVSEKQFQSSKNRFYEGDVIYGKLRPYLDKVIVADEIGVCTTEMIPLNGFKNIDSQYLRLVMKAPYFIKYANDSTHGMNLPRLGTEKARLACFPLPPLAEQHRIVVKVEELMALCDRLEQQQTDSNSAHEILVKTLLDTLANAPDHAELGTAWQRISNHFDTLFTTEHSIDRLKQTILQIAVMGKLVPQNPDDEPASVLLKKIAKEKARLVKEGKIKKQSGLPEISDEEKPFELPKGWEWVRLQAIVYLLGDGLHGTPVYTPDTSYYFVNGNNLINGKIEIKPDTKTVSKEEMLKYKKSLTSNSILVSINGTLGNVAFYNGEDIMLGKSACYFNLSENIFKYFIKIVLNSPYFLEYAFHNASGTTIKNLGLKAMNEFSILLPPLAEQHRIVAKVDELFVICDALKERINESEITQLNLADALVEGALS